MVEASSGPLRRVSGRRPCSRRTLSHRQVGWCGDHVSALQAPARGVYRRHRPEKTALYEVVRDNLETLYGAIEDGAIAVRIPKHARRDLETYLGCGILCWRGFARFRCLDCGESRLLVQLQRARFLRRVWADVRLRALELLGKTLRVPATLKMAGAGSRLVGTRMRRNGTPRRKGPTRPPYRLSEGFTLFERPAPTAPLISCCRSVPCLLGARLAPLQTPR